MMGRRMYHLAIVEKRIHIIPRPEARHLVNELSMAVMIIETHQDLLNNVWNW